MIKPQLDALIRGVANGLEETVLPELTHERARRQLKDGLRLLRRLSDTWGEILPTLRCDNRDIETTVVRLSVELEGLGALPDGWRDALDPARIDQDELHPDALSARNEALQELLADVHTRLTGRALDDRRRAVEDELRALYRRSLERERALAGR